MHDRAKIVNDITKEKFDLVVIGGGATGLGVAVDAITRGYKTLLIEKKDYAKATSSRSTKLAHGGVRYLAQANISLVKAALHEKIRMEQNAPFLVKKCGFVIPCYNYLSIPYYFTGLKLYDMLGGNKVNHKSHLLSKSSIMQNMPNLQSNNLKGGVEYYDSVFDDSRMAITLLRTFLNKGGVALNYTEVTSFIKESNKIAGVNIKLNEEQEQFPIKTKSVINATGIFTDNIRKLDDENVKSVMQFAQGIHLVLDKKHFPCQSALLIPKTTDGRILFVVPWHDKVLCGTTDTKVNEPVYEPKALDEEIQFVLQGVNSYFNKSIQKSDVLSIYAGIRPLVSSGDDGATSKIARDDKVFVSKSGLVTITGGKWTTYRKMGEKAVDALISNGLLPNAKCITYDLKLHGYIKDKEIESIPEEYRVYGSDFNILKNMNGFNTKLHDNLTVNEAQVIFAIENEQAQTVDDILSRRTRSILLDSKASIECSEKVASIMATKLNKDKTWEQDQVNSFKKIAQNYVL